MTSPDSEILREKLEILAGDRQKNRHLAALRVTDLDGLLQLPAKLQSAKAAGPSPTKEEFDALVSDVHALHRRLFAVMEALQGRLR